MRIIKSRPLRLILALSLLLASANFAALTPKAQTAARAAPPTRNVAPALTFSPGPRCIVTLRTSGTPDGSRVLVTSDLPLGDYTAHRRGDDFHLRIPRAEAAAAQHVVSGRGFTESRIEPSDGDLLLTFRLDEGAAVRVDQHFNRLDIIFTAAKSSAPRAEPVQEGERLKQVLRRVEELEARVKVLEAKRLESVGNSEVIAGSNETASTAPAADERGAVVVPPAASPQVADKANAPAGFGEDAHDSHGRGDSLPDGIPRLQIQGYADVGLRASSEKGRTTSFTLGQLDLFITSRLSEDFSVLGELILEANEDNTFSFSAHRLLVRYAPSDYFNFNAGRDHTSVGYYNTAYHHGSWFQTAASRPYLFAFENKGGILPLHNVGVSISGRVPRAPFGLRYVAEIGNGRSSRTAFDNSVQTAVDENNGKAFNLALTARPPQVRGLQAGLSVYRDRRTPAGLPAVGETIMAAHLVYRSSRNEMLSEGVLIRHAAGATVFYTPAFYTQFARRFDRARPYFRYQYVNAPEGDPILRTLEVGRRNGPSLGLRYDVSDFVAFKAQYDRTQRRRKSALDELLLQLAFTF